MLVIPTFHSTYIIKIGKQTTYIHAACKNDIKQCHVSKSSSSTKSLHQTVGMLLSWSEATHLKLNHVMINDQVPK